MKIKQWVVITDPLAFAKGDYRLCLTLTDFDGMDEWIYLKEIEIDVDISIDGIKQKAVVVIEEKQQEAKANFSVLMQTLENEKQSLLALDHMEG
jgi:hypothetical protein